MTADAPGRLGRRTGSTGTFSTAAIRRRLAQHRDFGPFDAEDLDASQPDPPGLLDFGSVRVPVPAEGTVTVEPTANGRLQAVHVALPGGRLSVSALAAPKSAGLWAELVAEIDSSLRDGGARVRSFQGDWGRELHARTGAATSVFVGVDGARWMLYGVATGPDRHAVDLEAALRRMLRGTVVDRGRSPFPVRTVLPLSVPDELAVSGAADAPPPAAAPDPAPAPVEPHRGELYRAELHLGEAPTVVRPALVPPAPPARPWPVPPRSVPPRSAPAPAAPARPLPPPARSVPPRMPTPPVRPAAAFPPPRSRRPAAADPTEALPVSRPLAGAPRADVRTPLWATPADQLGIPDPGRSDLGPDPVDDVGTDPFPAADAPVTEWWPVVRPATPAGPDRLPDPWATSGGWVADTPLHDELVNPPTEPRPAIGPAAAELRGRPGTAAGPDPLDPWAVGFVGGTGPLVADPSVTDPSVTDPSGTDPSAAEQTDTQAWPVPPAAGAEPPAGPTAPRRAARHAAPRGGRRRLAEEPGAEPPASTLDLAALVRERPPGPRRSRRKPAEPGTSRWDEAYRSPFGGGRSTTDGPSGLWGDDDRWGAENRGLPGRAADPDVADPDVADPGTPERGTGRRRAGSHRNWDRAADPSATQHGPTRHGPADGRPAADPYPPARDAGGLNAGGQDVDLWAAASLGAPAPHPVPDLDVRTAGGRAGRRRRPDPADPAGVDVPGATRPGRRRAPEPDPTTDPLPSVPADPPARRRRSVDVPPDPDWMHPALRAGRALDGSAPAWAFLAEPEPGSGSAPPAGRHHRPR